MKRSTVVHLLAVPPTIILVSFILSPIATFFQIITLLSYYYVPTTGIFYLAVWAAFVFVFWPRKESIAKVWRILYSVEISFFAGYNIWWYVSGQEFLYL